MRPDVLRVDISHVDGTATVIVAGELDMNTAPTLLAALDKLSADQRVLMDLARLDFMDSSGLSVLLVQWTRSRDGGGSFHVCNPSAAVRRIVDIAGLHDFLFDGA